MTEFTGIAYEPHPVSPERKAELRAQGLRIIDIQFQPATPHGAEDSPVVEVTVEVAADASPPTTPAPRARKPRANAT